MQVLSIPKQDLRWLNKAINKKDIREQIRFIIVKDGWAIATNGHVCHRVRCSDEPGLYTSEGIKIESDLIHPCAKRDLFSAPYIRDCRLVVNTDNLNVYEFDHGKGINKTYFDNAVDKAKEVTIQLHKDYNSIFIHYENREAIIMACKL